MTQVAHGGRGVHGCTSREWHAPSCFATQPPTRAHPAPVAAIVCRQVPTAGACGSGLRPGGGHPARDRACCHQVSASLPPPPLLLAAPPAWTRLSAPTWSHATVAAPSLTPGPVAASPQLWCGASAQRTVAAVARHLRTAHSHPNASGAADAVAHDGTAGLGCRRV